MREPASETAPVVLTIDSFEPKKSIVSTTGADRPVVTLHEYQQQVARGRYQRPLSVLDLAMPRDFEPAIGDELRCCLTTSRQSTTSWAIGNWRVTFTTRH